MLKKPAMLAAVAASWLLVGAEVRLDFASAKGLTLSNGAAVAKGRLTFPRSRAFAQVNGTERLDFSRGGTMILVVRTRELEAAPRKFRFFASKQNSFLFGLTNGQYNFSLCHRGAWSIALMGGMLPADNEFVHLTAVARRVDDPEQSRVGFDMEVYVNGQRILSKFAPVRDYTAATTAPIQLNMPEKNLHFSGEIAEFSFTARELSPGEIAAAAKRCKLVRTGIAPGLVRVSDGLDAELAALRKQFPDGVAGFTAEALRKAAASGAPEAKVRRGIAALKAGAFGIGGFNAAQRDFALLESSDGVLLLMLGDCGTAFPVVDLYDPAAGRGVFGVRSNSWQARVQTGPDKFTLFRDFQPGTKTTSALLDRENGEYRFRVEWDHPALTVRSRGTFSAAGLTMDLAAEAKTAAVRLLEFDFPRWALAKKHGKDYLLTHNMSGQLVADPTRRYNFGTYFPRAENTMQFHAYCNDAGNGVYVAQEDPEATLRWQWTFGLNDQLFVTRQTAVPRPPAGEKGKFTLGGVTAVRLFRGGWFEAGQVYKKFLRDKAAWWIKELPRRSTPEWMRHNAIWILAGVFPSRNEATLLYLREYFEQSFGVHLVGTTAKRIWPHFDRITPDGGKRLHNLQQAGIRVIPYSDPRLYSKRQPDGKTMGWKPEPLSWAVILENGREFVENYGDPCLIMCPAAPGWQEEYLRICSGIVKNGFDGIYHDQLPCGHGVMCFSDKHGHRVNDPGYWIRDGYARLYRRLNERLNREAPGKFHTGEDASEPYVDLIDGFTCWRWILPDAVPLFQSIYAGRIQFTGKYYNHQLPGDWESLFAKAAGQVVNGEQLGWITLEDLEAATPFRRFFKVLAHTRKALIEYFDAADRIAPLRFTRDPGKFTSNWGNTSRTRDFLLVTTPNIEHSVWRLPDNRRMALFINPTPETRTAAVQLPFACKQLRVCTQDSPVSRACSAAPEIVIPPYGVQVWLISDADNRAEADRVAAALHRTAGFDEGKTLHGLKVMRNKVPAKLKPAPGKLLSVTQAALCTDVYRRRFANGADRDAVLLLTDGSAVTFRSVAAPGIRKLELVAAVTPAETDGEFTVLVNGRSVGKVKLGQAGRYLEFRKFPVRLTADLPESADITLRFAGKSCRFKGITL